MKNLISTTIVLMALVSSPMAFADVQCVAQSSQGTAILDIKTVEGDLNTISEDPTISGGGQTYKLAMANVTQFAYDSTQVLFNYAQSGFLNVTIDLQAQPTNVDGDYQIYEGEVQADYGQGLRTSPVTCRGPIVN